MKNSNQKWYIVAGTLVVIFLAILLFNSISDFRDGPKTEADFRTQKLDDLKAEYPVESNLTVDERRQRLDDLSDGVSTPNDMTLDERRRKLNELQDNN